jgi:hypothetical protein
MAVVNQPALPPGASLEGVGRGRCARVLFNLADQPRKIIITKLNDLFYVFTFNSTSNAPKTIELRFPCASRSSHLPSILPSVAAASFWLVVVLIIIDRRPFKAAVFFIFYIFSSINSPPQTMGWCPPMRSPAHTPPLQHPPYRFRRLSG